MAREIKPVTITIVTTPIEFIQAGEKLLQKMKSETQAPLILESKSLRFHFLRLFNSIIKKS